MKGPIAGKWADRQFDAIRNGEPDAILSWDDANTGFVTLFKDTFGDPDCQATAHHKLALLKQGAKTAEQFIIDFEVLEAEANLGDGALTEHFKKSLQPRLVERIFNLENLPTSLREWKEYARRFDRQHHQFLEWQSQSRPTPSAFRPRPVFRNDFQPCRFQYGQQQQQTNFRPRFVPATQPAAHTPDVVPMEVDLTRRIGGFQGPRLLICWKCRQEGHRQNECPNQARNICAAQTDTASTVNSSSESSNTEEPQGFVDDQAVEA